MDDTWALDWLRLDDEVSAFHFSGEWSQSELLSGERLILLHSPNLVRCCTDAYLSESSETEKHGAVRWPGTGCWRHARRTPAVTSHVSFSTQRLYTTFQLRSSGPCSELQERAGFYARRSLEWSGQHLQFHSIAHSLDSFHRCRSYQNLARKMWTWR